MRWISQVRRGVLEFSILLLIEQRPRYGYDLISALRAWEPLAITEGTLYPLLRRLEKDGVILSYWGESENGPPRKFYRLSDLGKAQVDEMKADWHTLVHSIHQIETEGTTEDD